MSCKVPKTIISSIISNLKIILTDHSISESNKKRISNYITEVLHIPSSSSSSSSNKLLKGGFKLFQFLSALNAFLSGINDTVSPVIEPTTIEAIADVSLLSKEIVDTFKTCNETAPLPLLNISDPGDIIQLNDPLPKLSTSRDFLVNLKYSNETETDTIVPVFGTMSRPEEYSNYVDEIVESFLYKSGEKPKIEGKYYDERFIVFDVNLTPYGLNINLKCDGIFSRYSYGMDLERFASSEFIEDIFIKGLELFMYHAGAYDIFNAVFDKTNDAFSIIFLATDTRPVSATNFHRDPMKGPLLLIYDKGVDMLGPEIIINKGDVFQSDLIIFRTVLPKNPSVFLNQFESVTDNMNPDKIKLPQKQYPPSFRELSEPVSILHSSPALKDVALTTTKMQDSTTKRNYFNATEIAKQNERNKYVLARPRFVTVQTIDIFKGTEEYNDIVRRSLRPDIFVSPRTGNSHIRTPKFAMLHEESFFEPIGKDEPPPSITFNLDYKISPESFAKLTDAYRKGAAANRKAKQLTYDTDGLLSLFRNSPARAELEHDIIAGGKRRSSKKKRVNIFNPFAKRKIKKRKTRKH